MYDKIHHKKKKKKSKKKKKNVYKLTRAHIVKVIVVVFHFSVLVN